MVLTTPQQISLQDALHLELVFLLLKFPSISVMSDTFQNNKNYYNILAS